MGNYSVEELAQALHDKGGYNWTDARNAANNSGGRADDLAREFLGVSSSSGDGSFQSPAQMADEILKAQEQQRKEETGYIQKAFLDNPFVFDEEAARKSSTAEYEPFYQNLLSDYLKGVDIKRANIQDEQQLLQKLKNLDLMGKTRAADYAIEKAQQGYAGQGMFFSGLKERGVGRTGIEAQAGIQQATETYGGQERNLGRQGEALTLESEIQTENYQEQGKEAVEGGILQRRGEEQKAYYEPRVNQYLRLYPTGASSLSGYIPSEYLRY